MNEYQKLAKLIEDNGFALTKRPCHDPQSGWDGEHIFIRDRDGFEFDLSANGYCFNDVQVKKAIDQINNYLEHKNLTTLKAFKKYIDDRATTE